MVCGTVDLHLHLFATAVAVSRQIPAVEGSGGKPESAARCVGHRGEGILDRSFHQCHVGCGVPPAGALQQLAQTGEVKGVLLHQVMMGVDPAEVGVEGILDLLMAQFRHGMLGKAQVQRRHGDHAHHEHTDQQHQDQHD